MRILITFVAANEEKIKLPVGYQCVIQDIVFSHLNDDEYRQFIYDVSNNYENKNCRLYTFSKLFGDCKYEKEDKTILFYNEMRLVISTILPEMIQYLTKSCLFEGNIIQICNQNIKVKSVKTYPEPEINDEEEIYMLSPCCVYNSYIDEHQKRKITYYSPKEPEFETLIKQNIINKYIAYYNKEPENTDFSIIPLGNNKEMVTLYKGNYVIRGYKGNYLLKGSKDLIKLAYDIGIGGKNSKGFGCIELKKVQNAI